MDVYKAAMFEFAKDVPLIIYSNFIQDSGFLLALHNLRVRFVKISHGIQTLAMQTTRSFKIRNIGKTKYSGRYDNNCIHHWHILSVICSSLCFQTSWQIGGKPFSSHTVNWTNKHDLSGYQWLRINVADTVTSFKWPPRCREISQHVRNANQRSEEDWDILTVNIKSQTIDIS